jgi:hypothetical protein
MGALPSIHADNAWRCSSLSESKEASKAAKVCYVSFIIAFEWLLRCSVGFDFTNDITTQFSNTVFASHLSQAREGSSWSCTGFELEHEHKLRVSISTNINTRSKLPTTDRNQQGSGSRTPS